MKPTFCGGKPQFCFNFVCISFLFSFETRCIKTQLTCRHPPGLCENYVERICACVCVFEIPRCWCRRLPSFLIVIQVNRQSYKTNLFEWHEFICQFTWPFIAARERERERSVLNVLLAEWWPKPTRNWGTQVSSSPMRDCYSNRIMAAVVMVTKLSVCMWRIFRALGSQFTLISGQLAATTVYLIRKWQKEAFSIRFQQPIIYFLLWLRRRNFCKCQSYPGWARCSKINGTQSGKYFWLAVANRKSECACE